MAVPAVYTYHCLCTSLLLSTTHILSSLPQRTNASLDHAVILPLPPPPVSSTSSPPDSDAEDDAEASQALPPTAGQSRQKHDALPPLGYTVLLSMMPDRRPTIIRREDGFEKRFLYRCGRCRLVVGYELDEAHYADSQKAEEMSGAAGRQVQGRMKVIYLLPAGIMGTDTMASGRRLDEGEVLLDPAKKSVAVWE
ncbi:MAG: hypothetical protein M1818_000944 [Claussenomyces sp. TS43310]|nr:MAG: hypothetical protein M1818_000944 [Claussenomyces sp. TS43310]